MPAVEAREAEFRHPNIDNPTSQQTPHILSNPLQHKQQLPSSTTSLPQTQTVPARTVFHEATAALGPLINGIQTREQLDDLRDDLNDLM
jgi:hypothetical protein